MTRSLLALVVLLALLVPAWSADPVVGTIGPVAVPGAKAESYPITAPAPGTTSPAADAGHAAAAAVVTASKPWYTDLGSVALIGGTAALVALEKAAPSLLMRFLPMAGPYGGVLQLLLQGVLWFLKPKAQKDAEQLQADHADAFRLLSTTLQTVSNAAPVAALKARLTDALADQPELKSTFADFVAALEAQGIDHDTHGTGAPVAAVKPAA